MEMAEETEKAAEERKRCPYIPNCMKQQGIFCLNGWRIKMIFPYSAYIFQKDMGMSNHGVILLIYFLQRERLKNTKQKQ